jgi:hypothetical protein
LEQAILNAQSPIETSETEEVTVNGVRGILLNRAEIAAFRGSKPIDQYPLNQDSNPEVIRKSSKNVEHVQQVNVRFLKPPSGSAGPIIIKQDPSSVVEPAPPVIIRQVAAGSGAGKATVVREAPPKSVNVAEKVITLKGDCMPPPPRRVIIEKLPAEAAKPGPVCIDRWLAPEGLKRKVIFQAAAGQGSQQGQRNVIIEWSAGEATVRQQLNVKGVTEANPEEYSRQYGAQLVASSSLPAIAKNVQAPSGYKLAGDSQQQGLVELEGDLQALSMVDLDAEGLGEYKEYLARMGITYKPPSNNCGAPAPAPAQNCAPKAPTPRPAQNCSAAPKAPTPSCF